MQEAAWAAVHVGLACSTASSAVPPAARAAHAAAVASEKPHVLTTIGSLACDACHSSASLEPGKNAARIGSTLHHIKIDRTNGWWVDQSPTMERQEKESSTAGSIYKSRVQHADWHAPAPSLPPHPPPAASLPAVLFTTSPVRPAALQKSHMDAFTFFLETHLHWMRPQTGAFSCPPAANWRPAPRCPASPAAPAPPPGL